MEKIIVYGGAFNPPTIAHQTILNKTVELASVIGAKVWLLPSGNRTDKIIPTPEHVRMSFLKAMAENTIAPELVDINISELRRQEPIETYDTMQYFAENYPDKEFHWVFGSDSTMTMAMWKEGEWMMKNTNFIIIRRPGYPVNPQLNNATIVDVPEIDVSSTLVRERISAGLPYDMLVTPNVHKLLQTTI